MKCRDCIHSYDGADGVLRCRPSKHGAECTEIRASLCVEFEREPGADGDEQPWYSGGWCVTSSTEGRGG